ncbi:hypothetical protein PG993_011192 [Apiospora rasikravindrae]|uniref:Heterokaryon incompatibility domain-containing protein n=1 Tax=Apiospora rasikravindrae TaxID=990691 RepID=A0ABR1SDJ2_9PEZI
MSRWHAPSCSAPEVCLHEGIPHCRNCNETASTSLRDVKPMNVNASLSIPPDEPPGSLNLYWPPSIRWEDTPEEHVSSENQPTTANREAASQRHETESHSITGGSDRRYNIYPRPLLRNEIRLIRLRVEDDKKAPVHLTLEVYDSEECPEYETVSYTWTGDDGDADLSEVIFIGPYWDISFQTKNMLALLKYLRSGHGLRYIWIDAICINQADVAERSSQVANMGNIYFRCSRVVVWLGHDLVQETPKRYRRRRRLKEIEEEIGDTSVLEDLLRRRYFSRMWVIQEVVLAPSSIIPIGQVDFVATAKAAIELSNILGNKRWEGLDLFEVLHLVSPLRMHATDPRDRIFGVLGLLHNSPSGPLTPGYAVSVQNVMIGTMAHFLLDLKRDHLLRYALGHLHESASLKTLSPWCTLSSFLHEWRLFIGDEQSCDMGWNQFFIDRELTLEMRLRLVQSVQRTRFAYELLEIAMEVCSDLSPRIIDGALAYTGNAQLFGGRLTFFKSRPHELREDAVIWALDLEEIRKLAVKTEIDDYMRLFHAFKQVTGEDEISMALREPRPEDSDIYPSSPWPESVAQELGLDGKMRRIRIV